MDALRGLTVRGRSFLAAGLACFVAAVLVGQHTVIRIGVFLVALPLFAALYVARSRYRISCTRVLVPTRVPVGHTSTVRLRLANVLRR